ncbi:MAG: SET domain-containing protein-lysine N-methyltransferase [Patescibacteria group bacterium]
MLVKQHKRLFNLDPPRQLKYVYVWGKGLAIFTNKNFKKGENVARLKGRSVTASISTPEAIQISENKFVDTKYLVPEDFINHSCSPNVRADMIKRKFIAIKNIPRNTEITFNYLTTEYDMNKYGTDFECSCGSQNCFGYIGGFRFLTRTQKLKLKPYLSPFLLGKI